MAQIRLISILLLSIICLFGCLPEENVSDVDHYTAAEMKVLSASLNIPSSPFSYAFGIPDDDGHLNDKATLGRVLFYDKNLSEDATVSCASCHQQELAFSDNTSFSQGPNGLFTARNSIALGAVRSFGLHYSDNKNHNAPGLFWDERVSTIKEQLKQTIENPKEMGVSLDHITSLIETQDYYQILHEKAFNTYGVHEDQVLEALEAFINSIHTINSKFETEVISQLNYITSDLVTGKIDNQLGFDLFMQHCSSCHGKNLSERSEFNSDEVINIANNGLLLDQNDVGAYENTDNIDDIGKFKVPGLFNIELTAPYMHDGRFSTLDEVIEHYNSGLVYSENLADQLKSGDQVKQLNLTQEDKTALVEFLKSMTGEGIATNKIWSDPFK